MKMMNGKMTSEYFYDSVGRRRKLSDNTMNDIQRQFREGVKVSFLAMTYGVSASTIRAVTYSTPRQSDYDSERARDARALAEFEELDKLTNPGS